MPSACLSCLRPTGSVDLYHARCLRELFGRAAVPQIDLDLAKLHTVALSMVGRTTMSGVQRKISVGLAVDRGPLRLVVGQGSYILKPQASSFPEIPENELVTMRLAREVGIEIPPCGLIALTDRSLAYIVRRFDRTTGGRKLRQEDFCQLAEQPPKDKYEGSSELCVRLIQQYASEPLIDLVRLFRLLVFCWWTGNGDMHLKNFSLLADDRGLQRLSPAYDLVSTRLVIPDDPLALPVNGKREKLTVRDWEAFARYCGIPDRASGRVLSEVAAAVDRCVALIDRSPLSDSFRAAYKELLHERARVLTS